MHPCLFVRALSPAERRSLEAGRRSREAFVARRSQMVLASAAGRTVAEVAAGLGCAKQTVRDALRAFKARGLQAIKRQSNRPKSAAPVLNESKRERLGVLLLESPRAHGRERSVWTLELLAEVAHEQGLTPEKLSAETVRTALGRLGLGWRRARHWLGSPDPAYARKKSGAIG